MLKSFPLSCIQNFILKLNFQYTQNTISTDIGFLIVILIQLMSRNKISNEFVYLCGLMKLNIENRSPIFNVFCENIIALRHKK